MPRRRRKKRRGRSSRSGQGQSRQGQSREGQSGQGQSRQDQSRQIEKQQNEEQQNEEQQNEEQQNEYIPECTSCMQLHNLEIFCSCAQNQFWHYWCICRWIIETRDDICRNGCQQKYSDPRIRRESSSLMDFMRFDPQLFATIWLTFIGLAIPLDTVWHWALHIFMGEYRDVPHFLGKTMIALNACLIYGLWIRHLIHSIRQSHALLLERGRIITFDDFDGITYAPGLSFVFYLDFQIAQDAQNLIQHYMQIDQHQHQVEWMQAQLEHQQQQLENLFNDDDSDSDDSD